MTDKILVLNAGSSSVKFSLFDIREDDPPAMAVHGQIEGIGIRPHFIVKDATGGGLDDRYWDNDAGIDQEGLLSYLFSWVRRYLGGGRLRAVGHRVVHGGPRYPKPVLLNEDVLRDLTAYIPLFPLHLPVNLAPIRIISKLSRDLPQVACFDSSFHRTIPDIARLYGLPRALTDEGIRGYGFHGLSYEYIASVLPKIDPAAAEGRTVVAHLGSGASLCALVKGKSIACTLGFSGLDGLLMGTRPGTLDPGIFLYLLQEKKMDAKGIEILFYKESGLLGVSGISSDMRDLQKSPDPRAREAVALFVYRAVRELGSMAAASGGMDALVFTAGIGEHAPEIRSGICSRLSWLGLRLDEEADRRGGPLISAEDSKVRVWVIPTNEELMIAIHTKRAIEE